MRSFLFADPWSSVAVVFFFLIFRRPRRSTLFPYTTLFRSVAGRLLRGLPALVECDKELAPYLYKHVRDRSEEHTSELQSRRDLVCRLLLEKKSKKATHAHLHRATHPVPCFHTVDLAPIPRA